MTGEIGLSDKQTERLSELSNRKNGNGKPLTANMENELKLLIHKYDNPELPKGAKSYCDEWFISQKYNRKKEWFSYKVQKGLMVEHLGIQMLSNMQGIELEKNEQFFENEFMKGTPDVICNGIVFDIKSSWDIFSFPFFEKELPNTDYYWQLQCYMHLTGLENASIIYCLIDTPRPLIDQELKKLYFQSGGTASEWTPEAYKDLEVNYLFSDVAEQERIRDFPVSRDNEAIEKIIERVKMCREYVKTLELSLQKV